MNIKKYFNETKVILLTYNFIFLQEENDLTGERDE